MPRVYIPQINQYAQFPDDMDHDQIKTILNKKYPPNTNSNQSISPALNIAANNPLTNTVLGAGDALRNQLANIANVVPGVNIPKFQSGGGTAYNVGNVLGDIAGYMGAGELGGMTKLGQALGELPLGKIASHLGGGALYGAVQSPENREKGGLEGLAGSAIGEALPIPFKGIGKLAEVINPKKYTQDMAKDMQGLYQNFNNEAHGLYSDLLSKYKDTNLYRRISQNDPFASPGDYFETAPEDIKDFYGRPLRRLHDKFMKDPTYENGQKLQSQLGNRIRDLKKNTNKDQDTIDAIAALNGARKGLLNDIGYRLSTSNPKDYNNYLTATGIKRDILSPQEENPLLSKIVAGNKIEVKPSELASELTKLQESAKLPEGHYLLGMKNDLVNKIQKGKLVNDIGSMGSAIGAGELLFPGAVGLGGGAALGGALAKYASPLMVRVAQNPITKKVLTTADTKSQALRNSLLTNLLMQSNQQGLNQ